MQTVYRFRPVTKLKKTSAKALSPQAHAIHDGMAAFPNLFGNCNPLLPALLLLITNYDAAQQVVTRTKATGTAALRDNARDAMCTGIELERVYVLSLCDANPEQAQALILAAGMHVAAIGDHSKALLAALLVPGQPGTVTLKANRKLLTAGRGTKLSQINWRYTLDGGKTYVTSTTPNVKTTLTGLPSMTMAGFQVCITDSKGTTEWCPMVSILVH
jgi:hypothetical protein